MVRELSVVAPAEKRVDRFDLGRWIRGKGGMSAEMAW